MQAPAAALRALALLVALTGAGPGWGATVRVAVVAPDSDHLAWTSAQILATAADAHGLALELAAAGTNDAGRSPHLVIMPLRSLATQVPALEVLELPYFYSDLAAVHRATDGSLGDALRDAARAQGWEILAFWDEGLHVMSGLRRYDRAVNLTAMEFLLTRPDPVAERQLLAWNATPRHIRARNREAVLRECLIASRAATLQELQREGLERVHMTLALTGHRYEGWLLIAPVDAWRALPAAQRATLEEILPQVTAAQRAEAARREQAALEYLRAAGMMVHALDEAQRQAYIERLPPWPELLSREIGQTLRRELLAAACLTEDNRSPGPCAPRGSGATTPASARSPTPPAPSVPARSPE